MDDNGKYYSPEIWLERSKGAPLYIRVLQPRFTLDDEYMAEEEEESWAPAFPGSERVPAPMVNRLMNFLSPLMPQVCSLTTVLSWPYESTLELLLDCWKLHGTPGQAKVLKTLSNMGLAHITIRSPESYTPFLESLEVLHLHNTILSWSNFLFHNLTVFETSVGEGQWTIALFELAGILSSCPKLQRLSLDGLMIEPFLAPQPKSILLRDLQQLQITGFSNIQQMDGAAMLESVLAMIIPGQHALDVEISLSYISKSSQRAIDAVRTFVERANVIKLYVRGYQTSRIWNNVYFATQLGPLPRVQTLILEEWGFSDIAEFEEVYLDPVTCDNLRPINPEVILWPDVRKLYLHRCFLEKAHLRHLISLQSIQTLYLKQCYDGYQSRRPFDVGTQSSTEYVQLLSQVVPKVVHFPAWSVPWSSIIQSDMSVMF
ncbi:hypothetical protein FRC12_005512 [Ceratobasidium sp. 428]|nr:hypothetical protein FRC12_005512 [Ceratobasidium sp. 428]